VIDRYRYFFPRTIGRLKEHILNLGERHSIQKVFVSAYRKEVYHRAGNVTAIVGEIESRNVAKALELCQGPTLIFDNKLPLFDLPNLEFPTLFTVPFLPDSKNLLRVDRGYVSMVSFIENRRDKKAILDFNVEQFPHIYLTAFNSSLCFISGDHAPFINIASRTNCFASELPEQFVNKYHDPIKNFAVTAFAALPGCRALQNHRTAA
jgi:hypothetical protein